MAGRSAVRVAPSDVPPAELPDASLLRDDLELPEVSQLELVGTSLCLSQLNFSIDTNFYPLGSCTMKYNPKMNDGGCVAARTQPDPPRPAGRDRTGRVETPVRVQQMLGEVTGLRESGSLPRGAQGEYAAC